MSKKKQSSGKKTRRLKPDVWSIPKLESRVRELIEGGALIPDAGEDNIVASISAEFGEQLAENKLRFTLKALRERIDSLIWTKTRNKDLWRCHKTPWMMTQFREMHGTVINEKRIKRRLSEMRGFTKTESVAAFKAGMGRIDTSALPREYRQFRFAENSFSKPLVISTADAGQVPVINGAQVGIVYPDIEANTARRALADARKRGADAVMMTNILDIWTKRTAGYLAVYRADVSGIAINPDRIQDPDYRQEVQDILDGTITDKMIYQTLAERFEEVVDGLHKITHRKHNQGPEFPGPVYVLLGLKEEEVIKAMAYYEARYRTIVEQNLLEAALNMASRELEEAKAAHDLAAVAQWQREVERLGKRKSRAIITNHTGPQYRELARRMRAYVVWRLETTIPNCKVIAQGRAHIKCGGFSVKLTMPKDDKVRTSHLADLGDRYGADLFRNELPYLTLSCPPFSVNSRNVGREDSDDGQPVTKFLAVASSCVDGEFLREELDDFQKAAHPVQELIYSDLFKPGVTILRWNNGLLYNDDFPIQRLGRFNAPKDMANFAYPYPGLKYLTAYLATDMHFGAPDRRWVYIPEHGINVGAAEAGIELLRCHGVLNPSDIRIHMFHSMDDLTNGDMWFRPGYRPDPNRMRLFQFERWLNELRLQIKRSLEKGDNETVYRLLDEISRVSVLQMALHGEEFPFHQMEQLFEMHVEPNVDFYSAVLGRWLKSGSTVTGISKINRTILDTRDVGVVNFPTGNHRLRTLDQKDLEGDYVARHLRAMLGQLPEWQRHAKTDPNFLREVVRAPRFGGETYGWGLVQAPGAFKWGYRVHGSPARQSGWSDILDAVAKSDIARGDDSYGLLKYVTVTVYGDKHFYASQQTERMRYFMCAAGVHTNHYGTSGGFPPNNTGPAFLSIPVDGPESGPILFRPLPHDFLRDWFGKKPKDRPQFDWDTFLPEPV